MSVMTKTLVSFKSHDGCYPEDTLRADDDLYRLLNTGWTVAFEGVSSGRGADNVAFAAHLIRLEKEMKE